MILPNSHNIAHLFLGKTDSFPIFFQSFWYLIIRIHLQAFSVFVFIVECLLFPMLSRLYIIMYKKEVLV